MKPYTKSLIAIVVICFLAGCSGEAPKKEEGGTASTGASLFFGARVIPGDGKPAMENVNFLVENGKITAIGSREEVKPPRGSAEIDLNGKTVTPVFINVHAHPGIAFGSGEGADNYSRDSIIADLKRYEYYGIGAVGSLGSDRGEVAFNIRDEQREGKLNGARLYTAGRGIAPRGGAPSFLGDIPIEVSSAAEARKAVQAEADQKVDLISIWVDDNGRSTKMRPEVYKAVIDEAHKHKLKAVAHVFYLADAKDLVDSGIDGLVQSIRDRDVDEALISAMKAKNVFLTPSLTAHEARFVYAEKPDWLGSQLMREVYPAALSATLADAVTQNRFRRHSELPAWKQQYATAMRNLKKLSAAGVKIGFGTDSGSPDTYPGFFEVREMMSMAGAGMSPMDVITAASSVSASILGADDLGAITVGKSGNFLTFSNNPAEKIENIEDMQSLYINGSEVERSKLVLDLAVDVKKITEQDREKDRQAQIQAAKDAADAKLPHYGGFIAGQSVAVRSMPIPMPRGAKASVKAGPPDRIDVSFKASASAIRGFYADVLPVYKWRAAGSCWERPHPTSGKTQVLCVEGSGGGAVIQINEK